MSESHLPKINYKKIKYAQRYNFRLPLSWEDKVCTFVFHLGIVQQSMFPVMFEVTDSAGCGREAGLFKQQANFRILFLCTEYETLLIIILIITRPR